MILAARLVLPAVTVVASLGLPRAGILGVVGVVGSVAILAAARLLALMLLALGRCLGLNGGSDG